MHNSRKLRNREH